ncbi:transmembrane protein 33-like isoform X1 [Limulus polyphemus]|uniref:Transmembrane protein 33-like isoform X1 n=1 Tax=Limulus polyphemus TaxID=6850 RepID=A0ABM1RZ88_LIMPO|nr:transmembrane protein 33-like isoform X1 [Limulus polyphemus]XP_022236690.1 transmembrane protein 33-like isoform X1 [Limulus polyphemus]XP_022236693.1 transmembrane protein 33-like isoform X1 [Limulus polyphemus]XP_022236695.1 transmembrane protein 33-like isoform X1 [Limulus polyphemus]
MSDNQSSSSASSEYQNSTPQRGLQAVIGHMTSNKVSALLWMTRMTTMFLTFCYLIPLFGFNPYSCYYKALMSNAATSALRLHQRLPNFQFNREFLALLLIEDSCHYLFYSLIFLYAYPITLVLLPIFLFALLHSASYSISILDKLGQNSGWLARSLMSLVGQQQINILRLVAFTEIFLMPLTLFMIFTGRGSLLTPFVYYRFLTLRYASRRNPYTRNVFHELRLSIEMQANHPRCPETLRRFCHSAIAFVTRLAPPVTAQ